MQDPGLRLVGESGCVLAGGPDVRVQEAEELFCLFDGVEVEVDDHICRVIDRPLDALPPDAGRRAGIGEARERRVSGTESVMGCSMCRVAMGTSLVRKGRVFMPPCAGSARPARSAAVSRVNARLPVSRYSSRTGAGTRPRNRDRSGGLADSRMWPRKARARRFGIAAKPRSASSSHSVAVIVRPTIGRMC
jgi:hypothetical protein